MRATEKSMQSNFYTRYPNKDSENICEIRRKGFFNNLRIYCGICFSGDREGLDLLLSRPENDGLLFWNHEVTDKVNGSGLPGPSPRMKQQHMVGYLFELGYDLMISPEVNVSRSPGFETFFPPEK
jgi:hypothetical protein